MNKLMKKTLIILILLGYVSYADAQTFNEWFRQKATQKKYLIEQIAALKIYAGFLRTGYDIGKKGLGTIRNIKNGDFNLHRDFFGSLTVINPAIKNYGRVADIIALQVSILKITSEAKSMLNDTELFATEEKAYHRGVYDKLLADCGNAIEDLNNTAINSKLVLTDDERINRIDGIHAEMLKRYQFAEMFTADIKQKVRSKHREKRDVILSKKLFGLEN
jgi:hypothetical protein